MPSVEAPVEGRRAWRRGGHRPRGAWRSVTHVRSRRFPGLDARTGSALILLSPLSASAIRHLPAWAAVGGLGVLSGLAAVPPRARSGTCPEGPHRRHLHWTSLRLVSAASPTQTTLSRFASEPPNHKTGPVSPPSESARHSAASSHPDPPAPAHRHSTPGEGGRLRGPAM